MEVPCVATSGSELSEVSVPIGAQSHPHRSSARGKARPLRSCATTAPGIPPPQELRRRRGWELLVEQLRARVVCSLMNEVIDFLICARQDIKDAIEVNLPNESYVCYTVQRWERLNWVSIISEIIGGFEE